MPSVARSRRPAAEPLQKPLRDLSQGFANAGRVRTHEMIRLTPAAGRRRSDERQAGPPVTVQLDEAAAQRLGPAEP